jgi:RNA polymerase sigma-70 factor (ECF subfamily)
MPNAELIASIQKNDKAAKKEVFDAWYSRLSAITLRYAKNQQQAEAMLNTALNNCFNKIQVHKQPQTIHLDSFLEKEFIIECIAFIKSARSEYYVSSTVYATEPTSKNYDLFESNEIVDYRTIDQDLVIKSLQQMVPSQRLVFNLHVIDGYSLQDTSNLLECSHETVKSNLEKSRFNLQKNIENSLKSIKP